MNAFSNRIYSTRQDTSRVSWARSCESDLHLKVNC